MIINRIYEHHNLLSLQLVSFLGGRRTYQHPCNIAPRLRAGRSEVRISTGARDPFFKTSRTALEPNQPTIRWIWGSFPEVLRPGHEVYLSPPSSAAIKNGYTGCPRRNGQNLSIPPGTPCINSTSPTCAHGGKREKLYPF